MNETKDQRECQYCHGEGSDDFTIGLHLMINGNDGIIHASTNTKDVCIDIFYCPICGRKFN